MIERKRYLDRLLSFRGAPLIKVITGMRRCGKSSLLMLYAQALRNEGVSESRIVLINFESMAWEHIADARSLYDYVREKAQKVKDPLFLLLDEVQTVPGWEKAVNSLRVDFSCDIVVTGSNAQLLSGELATLLAGRYVELPMRPLDFAEFRDFEAATGEKREIGESLAHFLRIGGLPGVHELRADENARLQYLRDVFNSVLLKDVVARYKLRDVDLLSRILRFVMDNVGSTFSAKTITGFLKNEGRRLSAESVYSYLACLENAFVIERARRYDIRGKEFLATQEKLFVCDIGIRNALAGIKPMDIAGVMENAVYLHLKGSGYEVSIGRLGKAEVDFVAERSGKRLYVQVCYLLTPENEEREFAPLRAIRDNYPKYVVTMSPMAAGDREGVQVASLADFLLGDPD